MMRITKVVHPSAILQHIKVEGRGVLPVRQEVPRLPDHLIVRLLSLGRTDPAFPLLHVLISHQTARVG